MLTELNMWSQVENVTFAPHGPRGRLERTRQPGVAGGSTPVPTSAQIGAAGGHVASLDGAVEWKPASQMRERMGSSSGNNFICLTFW